MRIGYLNSILQRISIKRVCEGYYLRWYYNGWHYWFFLPGRILRVTEGENYNTIGTRKISMGSGQVTAEQITALRTIRNSKEIQLLATDGWMNIRIEPGSVIVANNYINGYEFDFIAIIGSREDNYSPVEDVPDNPSDDPSKYIYGFEGIYITHHAVTFTMILTGTGDITVNWGDGTSSTYTLTDVPLVITHTYTDGVTEHTIGIDGEEVITLLDASSNHITEIIIPPTATSLTTLILDDNELTDTPYIPPTVPLIYLVLTNNPLTICEVVIGSQIWMCKNYDTDYPGSKVYDDNEANRSVYGGLYEWNQVVSPGFCPDNFHVPTKTEWDTLIAFAGGLAVAGGKLKEAAVTHWNAPNTGAVDTYSFAMRSTGLHINLYGFVQIGESAYLWTASEDNIYRAWVIIAQYNSVGIIEPSELKSSVFAGVRLLKNFLYISPFNIFTDWFEPSKDELNAMYDELYDHGIGGFINITYGSSSEFDDTQSWAHDFNSDLQALDIKHNHNSIRACRSFIGAVGDYALRDIGPAGGWIFAYSGGRYYEAAPSDQSAGYPFSNIDNIEIGVTAQGTVIGTGQTNTTAIISQAGHINSAAKLCNDLAIVH